MNAETTNKTIAKIEHEREHTLTIGQTLDMVRAQKSKTEFFVYAKVQMDCEAFSGTQKRHHYEGGIQVTRKALIELLSQMASRMRNTPTPVMLTVSIHNNDESGYSAFYLC